MRRFGLLVLAAALSTITPPLWAQGAKQDQDAAKKDQDGLQGTWQVVAWTHDGLPLNEDFRKKLTVTFKGSKMEIVGPDGIVVQDSFKLDPSKTPKAIVLTLLDGKNKGLTLPAIYELNGDDLKLCVQMKSATDRPTAFKAERGSGFRLYVFQRSK